MTDTTTGTDPAEHPDSTASSDNDVDAEAPASEGDAETTTEESPSGDPVEPRPSRRSLRSWWLDFGANRWLASSVRATVVLTTVLVAYQHSLRTLARNLSYDTPLAYVALVPFLVLGVCLLKARPRPDEPQLPHRQVDWILGVPLLATAAVIALWLPDRLSYGYWTDRIDLIGLPFFTAGTIAIVCGSRVLRRLRLPVAALILAWPLPYEAFMDRVVAVSTDLTLAGVKATAGLVPGAHHLDGDRFSLGEGADAFQVSVAAECAGANSAFGWILVGGAALMVLAGRRLAKAAWLALGVTLVMVLNLLRILLLFWVGSSYGETAAIDWLHPYIGLVLFSVAVLLMLLAGRPLGVRLPARLLASGDPAPATAHEPGQAPAEAEASTAAGVSHRMRPLALTPLLLVVLVAGILGRENRALARFDPFDGVADADHQMIALTGSAAVDLGGWSGAKTDEIPWVTQYFGSDATWDRFTYRGGGPQQTQNRTVFMDIINTSDLESFSQYGLEACYSFHDYDILRSGRVDVGGPAVGQRLAYRDDDRHQQWSIVSWVWPVGLPGSDPDQPSRYERIVLLTYAPGGGAELDAAQDDLLAFARQVVDHQPTLADAPAVT